MDRIVIPQIPLRARVGVGAEERAREQDVYIDLEVGLDLGPAGKADALERTVDYDRIVDVVAATVQAREYRLIEAIAEACAAALLDGFPLAEVRVQVRKPSALRSRGVPYAAVEVVRRRA